MTTASGPSAGGGVQAASASSVSVSRTFFTHVPCRFRRNITRLAVGAQALAANAPEHLPLEFGRDRTVMHDAGLVVEEEGPTIVILWNLQLRLRERKRGLAPFGAP